MKDTLKCYNFTLRTFLQIFIHFLIEVLFQIFFYITRNLRPAPQCISVKLKILPPEKGFRILVVACPTFGFLVLALTAIPINGAVALIAGFKNLFQAVCVSLKIFVVCF